MDLLGARLMTGIWSNLSSSATAAIGETDCEELGGGWLVQPVNAISSLGYTVIGLAMAGWAVSAEGRERGIRWTFIAALVATGLGSFLFHGPQPGAARFLHDITFLAALLVLVVADVAAGRRWSDRTTMLVFGSSVVVAAVVLIGVPDATNVLTAIAAVLLVASDVSLFGRGRRRSVPYVLAVALLAAAVGVLILGRTGAPLCDPDAPYQLHGLWHLLSAGALAAYAVATGAVRAARGAESIERSPT